MDVNDIDIMMGTFTKSFGAAGTFSLFHWKPVWLEA
jgi:7-keto-8-aminopelargonate synthetase-like enzyme